MCQSIKESGSSICHWWSMHINNTMHSSTGKAPFEIVEGGKKVPPILHTKNKIFEADKYVQDMDEMYKKVKVALEKTQAKQKKGADRQRRDVVFSLGDWVLLRFEKARLKKMKGKERLFPKLSMRYYGPFQVCDIISDVAFTLKLLENWKIHNAFHVSLLKPYVGDVPEDMPAEDQPEVEELDEILVPEQILAHKERKVKGKVARRYLVKFRNYPPMDAKWMEEDDYDAVVVCLGAGVSKLEEFSGKLPLTYCRGVVTHLVLPPAKKKDFEFEGPSIVGDTWIAAQGSRNLVVGATKDWDNCDTRANVEPEAAAIACSELFTKAAAFYPPIKNWILQGTCAGVRAMAPRTPYGKLPLAGCIDEVLNYRPSRKISSPYYWIFGGLGSRGLIYHAWVGKKVAEAVVSRSETCLPRELLLWKRQGNCKPVFSID
ncbi:hypothetical protein L7F22_048750 [Adiantum nelumboides]|nr:hypothetical protein [Adiantum nelumboides]